RNPEICDAVSSIVLPPIRAGASNSDLRYFRIAMQSKSIWARNGAPLTRTRRRAGPERHGCQLLEFVLWLRPVDRDETRPLQLFKHARHSLLISFLSKQRNDVISQAPERRRTVCGRKGPQIFDYA